MDNKYLIDQETLEKFVRPLVAQKYPESSKAESDKYCEEGTKRLDKLVFDTIFGEMTNAELEEINKILEEDGDQDVICEFFDRNNINLKDKISKATEMFKTEFLGGEYV